jgi:DNA ligase-1
MKLISRLFLIAIASVLFSAPFTTQSIAKQNDVNVLLAQIYQRGIDVKQYLVSEKFDGVRAVWDGSAFHTHTGPVIAVPAWFTQDLPKTPLDGEPWLAYGKFDALSDAVRKNVPINEEWRGVSQLAFELPNAPDSFFLRVRNE